MEAFADRFRPFSSVMLLDYSICSARTAIADARWEGEMGRGEATAEITEDRSGFMKITAVQYGVLM